MTCIVGIVDGSVVLMSSDSAATQDSYLAARRGNSKVWRAHIRKGNVIIQVLVGFCGHYGCADWLRHSFQWPDWDSRMSMDAYMAAVAHPALKKTLEERYEAPLAEDYHMTLLVGIAARQQQRAQLVRLMVPDGDVQETGEGYDAIGSGGRVALGSMHALADTGKTSFEKLDAAMCAAMAFDSSVRGPMYTEVLMTDD